MRRTLSILFLFAALEAPANVITADHTAVNFFASSYDTQPYHYSRYVASWGVLGNPQWSVSFSSCSGSGSIQDNNEKRLEMLGLALWANASHFIGIIQADDNGGFTSNTVRVHLTNTFSAPALLFNGTAYTNEGGWAAAHSVTWIAVGCPPHDSTDGDSGQISRNGAVVKMCADFGLLGVDMWNPLWNGGWSNANNSATSPLGFYSGSHPYLSGDLAQAILIAQALAGTDTNVSLATVDWNSATVVSTNHCVIGSVSKTGNVLTFTRHDDRLPMGWDVPDGTITNDCRAAFVAIPSLINAFRFSIGVTNLPAGNYNVAINGVHVATLAAAALANWNMFTNAVGPYWDIRKNVLGYCTEKCGADRVTLLDHNAGSGGTHGRDMVNYISDATGLWASGDRGDVLIAALASDISGINGYDTLAHNAAQPPTVTFTITLIQAGTGVANPINLNVGTLTIFP